MKNRTVFHSMSLLAIVMLFLVACSPPPSSDSPTIVEIVQTDSRQEIYQETVRLNNCGGTRDAEQTITRSFSTNIEGNVTVKAGYEVIEGSIGGKYGEAKNITKSIKVVAAPGANMEFVLEWTEQTWIGRVTASNETGTYTARSPISVEQVNANNLGCGNSATQATQDQAPTTEQQPTQQIIIPTEALFTVTFEVFANLSWQDTGVQIKPGDRLRIVWDGRSKWRGINSGDFSDPLGGFDDPNANYACTPLMPVEQAGWNALVAKIGESGNPTNPFKTIPFGDGTLYLAMNDCDKQRYDNEGSVIVTIEVQPQ